MSSRATCAPKTVALAVAAVFAVAVGVATYAANVWPRIENESVDLRFSFQGATRPPDDVAVVAINAKTFSDLHLQWPFPRRLHAAIIERLHADGASTIVYDIQFTEPSRLGPGDDLALYDAIGRAGKVVLATSEVNARDQTNVLGGEANLRHVHAVAAASNLPADADGVIRRYPYSMLGLKGLALSAAETDGHAVTRSRFNDGSAWIDFRGPPGTINTVSFSDVLRGRVAPRTFSGKIVVVGAAAPTLQDVHPTSTASAAPMTGAEIQANAIWTALHGNPLQAAPAWLALLAILLGGAVAPLASLRLRVVFSTLIAAALAGTYLVLAQLAFDSGTILVLTYPLATLALGTISMVVANYVAARIERDVFSRQLRESQFELIQRLAQAIESRDAETGEHVHRIGFLCHRLALAVGWTASEADMLAHASAMHDIGKIGVPDRVLLKPGKLDGDEWAIQQTHTTIGASLLARSANPFLQMAEEIARTHHERWDGSGYPAGLKGEEIPMAGRICAVCDVYDALLSKRPYKDPWTVEEALAEIERGSGTHFDPRLTAIFVELAPQLTGALEAPSVPVRSPNVVEPLTA